ncbi:MAG: Maf family protein, partial [Selenomonas sp.]|nr:Maf family protein [Selenomonas sp.]
MFILASGSPRRKELLQQIGARFEVLVSEAEEITGDEIAPEELVARNAAAKAQAVAQEHPEMA